MCFRFRTFSDRKMSAYTWDTLGMEPKSKDLSQLCFIYIFYTNSPEAVLHISVLQHCDWPVVRSGVEFPTCGTMSVLKKFRILKHFIFRIFGLKETHNLYLPRKASFKNTRNYAYCPLHPSLDWSWVCSLRPLLSIDTSWPLPTTMLWGPQLPQPKLESHSRIPFKNYTHPDTCKVKQKKPPSVAQAPACQGSVSLNWWPKLHLKTKQNKITLTIWKKIRS